MNTLRDALNKAYALGFSNSGEGYNGECPFDGRDFEQDAKWIEYRDAALAALDAETEVKVRELEWLKSFDTYSAATPFDTAYTVYKWYGGGWEGGDWKILHNGREIGRASDERDAKASARADFERRIRSALVTPEARS